MADRLAGYRLPRVQANPDMVFKDYLPGQVEHCLRLTLERLQKTHRDATAQEIQQLSQATADLYSVYRLTK